MVIDVRKVAATAASGLLLVAGRHPVDEPPYVMRPRTAGRPGRFVPILSRYLDGEHVVFRVNVDGTTTDVRVASTETVYTAPVNAFVQRPADFVKD